jgi:hypothetical protein
MTQGGHKIGVTNDGMVFFLVLSSYEGKQFQTILTWHPDEAKQIANDFIEAAEIANGKREGIINVGDSPNINQGGSA